MPIETDWLPRSRLSIISGSSSLLHSMFEIPDSLNIPPYHNEIVAYLQSKQAELWGWFDSNRLQEHHADAVRLELLKSAYRVDGQEKPRLHELAHEASRQLGIDVPITLYHSQRSDSGMNAHLAYLPEEVHIVLHGPLTEVLDDYELRALIGHELSHYIHWTGWDRKFLIADQILGALAADGAVDSPQSESFRLFRLFTEIFCDRGARIACGKLLPTIGALVKTETGVREVNAENYLKQSEEIAASEASKTAAWSHPECYIRARALKLWDKHSTESEDEIRGMIEGSIALNKLDLLAQQKIGGFTRRLVDAFLSRAWLRTESLLGHARLFFDGYEAPSNTDDSDQLAAELQTDDSELQDYYCYVLLDFVTIDRELDEVPLAVAFLLTKRLKLEGRFQEIVRKELGIGKKHIEKIRCDAEKIVNLAAREVKSQ